MDKVWWKTIILWSNLVPAVKSRTRRTTATVEVENNIVKNLDIETLMRKKSTNLQTDTNDMYEQWKPKKRKVFSKEETDIMNNFKVVMEYRKGLDAPSQSRIALEIRELSTHSIGFNQSMVSLGLEVQIRSSVQPTLDIELLKTYIRMNFLLELFLVGWFLNVVPKLLRAKYPEKALSRNLTKQPSC
uniref:Uncharacterized protein n=1 Tax=Rhizophagus irregularis (strain DAOM 181602 / DAOM 197198 / MUCL 43194) TaxID=747089 RepID=U9U4F5_RHIID